MGLIDLGEAAPIDAAIKEFRARIMRHDAAEAAKTLYDLAFAPLLPELGEVKDIFISPDGNLNLIPFEVLIGPDGRFLIEDYTFTYLAAGRDLIGNIEPVVSTQPPLIIGDPDFDFSPGIERRASVDAKAESSNRLKPASDGALPVSEQVLSERGSHTMSGFTFKRLPGTRDEVEAIQVLFGTDQSVLYTDRDALEEALLDAEAPRILHLATHGFFLEDQELPTDARGRGLSLWGAERGPKIVHDPQAAQKAVSFENPLLRSGIVLAGVNPSVKAGRSDGVVTAEKILSLKLQGTELVVLSACETGLGDIQVGEGVYGLRRVFLQAGAQSLVMSLWSVPDNETKELMTQFYRNFLSGDMPRNQALRQAMLQQMDIVKQRYGNPDPFYWGAFIFLGAP